MCKCTCQRKESRAVSMKHLYTAHTSCTIYAWIDKKYTHILCSQSERCGIRQLRQPNMLGYIHTYCTFASLCIWSVYYCAISTYRTLLAHIYLIWSQYDTYHCRLYTYIATSGLMLHVYVCAVVDISLYMFLYSRYVLLCACVCCVVCVYVCVCVW